MAGARSNGCARGIVVGGHGPQLRPSCVIGREACGKDGRDGDQGPNPGGCQPGDALGNQGRHGVADQVEARRLQRVGQGQDVLAGLVEGVRARLRHGAAVAPEVGKAEAMRRGVQVGMQRVVVAAVAQPFVHDHDQRRTGTEQGVAEQHGACVVRGWKGAWRFSRSDHGRCIEGSSPALDLAVEFAPVLELVLVDLDVQFHHSGLQPFLDIRDRLVVDRGADLLQKEAEQGTRRDVADALIDVLLEVPLYGGDHILACVLAQRDGHVGLHGAAGKACLARDALWSGSSMKRAANSIRFVRVNGHAAPKPAQA